MSHGSGGRVVDAGGLHNFFLSSNRARSAVEFVVVKIRCASLYLMDFTRTTT